jgi:hypothetical protein
LKKILLSLNLWVYGKLKEYADENGITVVGAIRLIINQFFKNGKRNDGVI